MFFKIKKWIIKKLLSKAKLRKWLELEDIRQEIQIAVEKGEDILELLCSYLSTAICSGDWEELSWIEFANDFVFSINLNSIDDDYPLFTESKITDSRFKSSSWIIWANLFADKYGWTLEYIANLDVNESICLMQEILYSGQIEREWEWSLSDKSVEYDKRSGQGKFRPLDRPAWMKKEKLGEIDIPVVKIDSKMIPAGIIFKWDENVKH